LPTLASFAQGIGLLMSIPVVARPRLPTNPNTTRKVEDMTDRQGLSFVSGLLLGWLFASTGVAQRLNHDSYLGKAPPELTSQPDHWLGWHEKVTLADLRGKVIWLQFNF
jgi:hypothetical protein